MRGYWERHAMPYSKLLLHAEELRAHAEEVSARADTFRDDYYQQKMREVAGMYHDLAERLEQDAGPAREP